MTASALSSITTLVANLRAIARTSGTPTALSYVGAFVTALPEILRRHSLAPADERMARRRWPYRLQGVSFELEGRFFSGAREMYCRQVYFPTPACALQPGTTVLDLGANVGLFSLLAAKAGCKVIAVEAQRGFVRELTDLASTQGVATRIVVENALIGTGSGIFSDSRGLASASHADGFTPPTVTMEELLARHGVEQVDFLKIDIEGSEFDLFRSETSWLRRVRRIAMEVHPEFGSVPALRRTIEAHDMSVELRDNGLAVVSELRREGGYLFATR